LIAAASDTLFALRPVTFRYKQEIDPEGVRQFGLVAEEVEKVDPNLIFAMPTATLTRCGTKQ
jgi:Chaperone of endosialidase